MNGIDIQRQLRRAMRQARAIELRRFEEQGEEQLRAEVLPRLHALLGDVGALVGGVAHGEDASGQQAAADVAFMAQLELGGARERLAAVDLHGARLLAECGSAQRALLRACSAILEAFETDGAKPRRARWSVELQRSLRLRAAYAGLRRELAAHGEPNLETIAPALTAAGEQLERFTDSAIFEEARIEDRVQLRLLRDRVRGWLVGNRNAQEGVRLWQDVSSCAALLGRINLRAELVEHDRALILGAAALILEQTARRIPERLAARLKRLAGRDEAVDTVLASDAVRSVEAWRAPLARLLGEVRPPASAVAWGDELAW